jgi:integrase
MAKKRWLLDMARAHFGDRPIAEISAIEILVPLRKAEAAGNYETARRLRATIGQVFRYAIATARADNDPTFGLRGALITPKVTHRAALTDQNAFAGVLRAIWTYEGSPETQTALKLMVYLHTRPGELRLAEWPELDLNAATWTIPGSRMKMRREHRKPLPRQAVDLFRIQRRLTGEGRYVFPSIQSRRQPISENRLNGALRRLGFTKEEMTSHGFRASANSLLNESGKWNPDAIEAEQSRVGVDEVRHAYHRAQYWEERTRMQQRWADEIDRMRSRKPER